MMVVGTFCTYEELEAWLGEAVDRIKDNPLRKRECWAVQQVMLCLKDSGILRQGVLYEAGYDLLRGIDQPPRSMEKQPQNTDLN